MLKYLVACAATLYVVLLVLGDESRRPDVTRQATDEVTGLSLAAFPVPEVSDQTVTSPSAISDAEAVAIALQAGRDFRAGRKSRLIPTLAGTRPAAAPEPQVTTTERGPVWYVSGTRVNLRAGPGTGNAVVGQVALGDSAEVLGERDGWYEIRLTGDTVSGWIYGKFLTDTRPG